jgi:ubiquinol-cytochrome c reductase cytochrome b subunit
MWAWIDERAALSPILKHPVPRERGWRAWMYVLGSATLTSFLVAVITGIPIATTYIPSTGQAYNSILWLDNVATLGKQLRALHNISATAMLVLVGLHVMRVFLTGAFKYPRELNWLSGVALLFLTIGLLFTGQILRWDNSGLWTMSILSSMSSRTPIIGTALAHFLYGGQTLTGITLSRYFALHVFVLPGLLLLIVGFHLYLVIKVGISESPRTGAPMNPQIYRSWYENLLKREGVPFWPDVAWRDAVASAFVIAVIIALTLIVGPPELSGPPDPTMVAVQPRPDWYFIWLYAALALLPYGMENFTIILGPLLFVIIMVILPFVANRGERSLVRRPWAGIAAAMAVLMVSSLTVTGELAPWSPRFEQTALPKPAIAGLRGAALRGATLFSTAGCQYCHTYYKTSGGIRGPDLENIGSQLTPEEMTVRILNGGDNMPAYAGSFSPAQVHDLVDFLMTRHLWTNSGATRHPAHRTIPTTTPKTANSK